MHTIQNRFVAEKIIPRRCALFYPAKPGALSVVKMELYQQFPVCSIYLIPTVYIGYISLFLGKYRASFLLSSSVILYSTVHRYYNKDSY